MNVPRISVVMSVYNGQRHLRRAVESILRQTSANFEFIIVNDGSTDDSRVILGELAAQDSRIRVIDQPNRGLTCALCSGCHEARGEFIARQDADDWSTPGRLAALVAHLDANPAVVMAGTWAVYVDDDNETVDRIQPPIDAKEATRRLLHERCGPPAHGAIMFRRSAYEDVGGYRTCFYYAQDFDLWLRLGRVGLLSYVPEEHYHVRVSPLGISGVRSDWQLQFADLGQLAHEARVRGESDEAFVAAAEQLRQDLLSAKLKLSHVRRQQSAAYYRMGTCMSRLGNPRACSHFWSSIRLNPLHWRSWCRLSLELIRRPFARPVMSKSNHE
ncbi:MAG: glycosyltransferase family 2 protein [Planctomycetia bacterium]|nr:glycosyltransferase family 2 protein [Planctomycetia bacterium]